MRKMNDEIFQYSRMFGGIFCFVFLMESSCIRRSQLFLVRQMTQYQRHIPLVCVYLFYPVLACPGTFYNGTQWYLLLTKSAVMKVDPNTPFTASTLYDYVVSDPILPPSNILNSNLVPSITACGGCTLSYTNNLLSLRVAGTVDASCFPSGSTWSLVDTTDLLAPACVASISSALTSFDRCSDVTYSLLTGMPVSTQCSYADFLDIDAKYHSYGLMMSFALNITTTIPNLSPFQDAINRSTCGVCFSDFINSISSVKIDTSVRNFCMPSANSIYSSTCQSLPSVRAALVRLTNCVGGYNLSNLNAAPSMCSSNEILLVTKAYNIYGPIITCSVSNNPLSAGAWTTCIQSAKREISPLISSSLTCRGCLLDFAAYVYNNAAGACSTAGPYDPACIASTAGARNTLYICAGFRMNVSPSSSCPAVYAINMEPRYQSYIPMIEFAVEAGSSMDKAVGFFYNQTTNSPLLNATSYIPCQSCFSALAADLAYAFTLSPGALLECKSLYTGECMTSTVVASALDVFHSCSGLYLDNTSPYTCSKSEIEAIQLANIPKNLYYGVFGLGSTVIRPAQALNNMLSEFTSLRTSSPGTNGYMCSRCFQQFYSDLANVTPLVAKICQSVENIPVCFAKLMFEVTRFRDCAGFSFDFSQPPVNQVSLVVPVVTTTSTPSNNTAGLKDGDFADNGVSISTTISVIPIFYLMLVT